MDNEIRLIDANALKANLPEPTNITQKLVYKTLCDLIDNAPTVEQPQGEWLNPYLSLCGEFSAKCNICGEDIIVSSSHRNFCPNCGTRMKHA